MRLQQIEPWFVGVFGLIGGLHTRSGLVSSSRVNGSSRLVGFGFKYWGRGFLSFEAVGFSIAEFSSLMAEAVTEDILLHGDPYCVLRDLCGGDGVFKGGGLCCRQYICCFCVVVGFLVDL